MNKFLEILFGLILIVVPIIIVTSWDVFMPWGTAALELIKGAVVVGIILVGLLFVVIGIADIFD